MKTVTSITINNDFITLGQFLKLTKIIINGGQARFFLSSHNVLVNNILETRRGRKLRNGDEVNVIDKQFVIQNKEN